MSFDQLTILLCSALYLCALLAIAWLTDRRLLPDWLVENPLTQVLSLGVFASAWTFYGVVDLANRYGYGALSYYMGVGGLFIFAPLILIPLFRLTRTYQLHSVADLLVFRFRQRWIGIFTTLCMLLSALPLLALQIQVVADTALILTYNPQADRGQWFAAHQQLSVLFCIAIFIFAAMFGSSRERHRGLVAAMAVESLLKLVALAAVGLFAVYGIFGDLPSLDRWLSLHPEQLETLYNPPESTSSYMLVMLFFSTAIALPHVFHMGFTENTRISTLRYASWGVPLYLLGLSLPVMPILWAGYELGSALTPEYFTLGVPLAAEHRGLTALAYLGGLSAATGSTIVITLALATMCLNHWILPWYQPSRSKADLYGVIAGFKRLMAALVIASAYAFYKLLHDRQGLTSLAILGFIETMQFMPGVLAVLFGPQANQKGLAAGLVSGTLIWLFGLMIPTITGVYRIYLPWFDLNIPLGMSHWSDISMLAICINLLLFVVVSRLTRTSLEEQRAAEQCSMDEMSRPLRLALDVRSADEMRERLSPVLGAEIAGTEIVRALQDLGQEANDTRPYALRRLRDRLEANLSGLMGALVAHTLMDRVVPFHAEADAPLKEDLHFVENRINQYRHHLTGMAAELDNLRRHHRLTLESLPMAVCSVGHDGEVLLWNQAMANLTHIDAGTVLGSSVGGLPYPWGHLLADFLADRHAHARKQKIALGNATCWLNLHKAEMGGAAAAGGVSEGQVIMIEDLTETELLEQELLHSERLASIGRLAAGVAHEVGNPVTGIACLAQNLKYEHEPGEIVETAEQILSQTDRITRIVQSLMHFAHTGEEGHDALGSVDLYECVEEAIHLLSLQKDRTQVHYNNLLPPDTCVQGDEQKLTQLLINLLSNARDASAPDSAIDISARARGGFIELIVRDYGHGISQQHIRRLFEPFFTTKPAGQGTGLGLSLVYSIVEEHGGHIDVKSPVEDGAGTEFVVGLPVFTGDPDHPNDVVIR